MVSVVQGESQAFISYLMSISHTFKPLMWSEMLTLGVFFPPWMTAQADDQQLNIAFRCRLRRDCFFSFSVSALYMDIQHSCLSLAWNCQEPPPSTPTLSLTLLLTPCISPPLSTPSLFTSNAWRLLFSLPPPLPALTFNFDSFIRYWKLCIGKIHFPILYLNAFYPLCTFNFAIMTQ